MVLQSNPLRRLGKAQSPKRRRGGPPLLPAGKLCRVRHGKNGRAGRALPVRVYEYSCQIIENK
jgi:hypothetical protein